MSSAGGSRAAPRLHLGCGTERLPGWINVDRVPSAATDVVADLALPLPVRRAGFIFAEHVLEHLRLDVGLRLLADCREVLEPDGVLRLSTPNLDWVWVTAYESRRRVLETRQTAALIVPDEWTHDGAAVRDALKLNQAFHGWGHRFLYNRAVLEAALKRSGFAEVRFAGYGESEHPELVNLERHEKYDDAAEISHLLVAEASGRSRPSAGPWPDDHYEELISALDIE